MLPFSLHKDCIITPSIASSTIVITITFQLVQSYYKMQTNTSKLTVNNIQTNKTDSQINANKPLFIEPARIIVGKPGQIAADIAQK